MCSSATPNALLVSVISAEGPHFSPRKNTPPERRPMRAVLRSDKSLRPTTDYPFLSFFPSAPLGVGLLLGQRFPALRTTETGASPSSRPLPTRPSAIAYLSHFGNSLLPGRGGGRHGCSRRPRANPGPQKSALKVRERPKTFRQQTKSRNRKRNWLG